jgi:hypothetical protein
LKTITIDFETYYDPLYQIRNLSMEGYIRHPSLFEALCLAVKPMGQPAFCLRGAEAIEEWFLANDLKDTAVIAQNSAFDGLILSHHYGVCPEFWFDTMSMANAVNGPLAPASLAALSERYALPQKIVPYNQFIGKRWDQMSQELQDELCDGCMRDAENTEEIFKILLKDFPPYELEIIDLTLRMFTEPKFIGDTEIFTAAKKDEEDRKFLTLNSLGMTSQMFNSAATFLRILEDLGEDVPRKSGANDTLIPAIAKTDPYVRDNQDRDDIVGELLRARIEIKSNIKQSRAGKLEEASTRGPMPAYHKYFAAVTGRWGGGDGVNWQNLPKDSTIRSGIKAPEGCSLIIIDFKAIEYRILMALAQQQDRLDIIASGEDIYDTFPLNAERFFKKKVVLGCGYGQGVSKFMATCKGEGIDCNEFLAKRSIDTYRSTHPNVVSLWSRFDKMLPVIASGQKCHIKDMPAKFEDNSLLLPDMPRLKFTLAWCEETRSWFRKTSRGGLAEPKDSLDVLIAKGYTSYWGGALTEFVCQAIARLRLAEFMLDAKHWLRLRPSLLVHDEYVCVVKDEDIRKSVEGLAFYSNQKFTWWENGPPFGSEITVCKDYGSKK